MARRRIDPVEIQQLIEAGYSQAACARHFGVSETAIYLHLRKVRIATSRVAVLERGAELVEKKLTASDRLQAVQAVIDRELRWAVRQAEEPGADRAKLADVILRLAGEVRQQLGLQLAITRALVDMKVVRAFQETVIDTIREESPDVAVRIVERLKARRALRATADLLGQQEGTDAVLG
ncbi:MAG: hypothetical protein AB1806_13930 [Acidobacteriota bacterium]